ncbi:BUD13 homolog isoform X2 [Nycticebus coucang]|uniref:BUD13 homolog isoform X2 n=1 Tax=Nycticebus coucang TaxID=9470 RepID=UPI00234CE0CE|nr:BUD13 homolog isoform X2 [Nycticebus coucang]
MAAAPLLSKAEYLKRYLSGADAGVDSSESGRKRRKKRPKSGGTSGKGMRIVDDDVSWTAISTTKPEKEEEEDDGDLPVVAEFVDERPEEVKQMEAFRSSAKWKLLGDPSPKRARHDTPDPSPPRRARHDTPDPSPPRRARHDTPDPSPSRRARHDTPDPSPPRRARHDTTDSSPHRRARHDTTDPSPPRRARHDTTDSSPHRRACHDTTDPSPPRRARHDTLYPSPPRRARHDTPDPSPPRRARHDTLYPSPPRRAHHDTPDPSPPRRARRHDTLYPSPPRRARHDTLDLSPRRRVRHDTPDPSPPRRTRHDTPDPSPPRRVRHDSLDYSPPRKSHRNSTGVSPRRVHRDSSDPSPRRRAHHNSSDVCSPRRARNSSPDTSQPRRTLDSLDTRQLRRVRHDCPAMAPDVTRSLPRAKSSKVPERTSRKTSPYQKGPLPKYNKDEYDSDLSPPRKKQAKSHFGDKKQLDSKGNCQRASDSDLSPPRHKQSLGHQNSDSDLSPLRNRPRHRGSDSDLSPPRRRQRTKSSDSDLSPPRRSQPAGKKAAHMYSGAKTGLVLTDIQREQQELKKRDQETVAFEAESQYAETVFRDKSGRKRNLKLERLEQRRKAEKDSERDELYAQWGKGLAQSRQQQQNVEDAMKEMQKPLARYIDDEDLDRMLREQEREGDPMAEFIKKNKAKENKNKKVRPRYSGPAPPPNRFNIWPGYRWDGVDRSNGFEQKRFARLASKKAVEELAYKWSVEDM